MRKLTLTLLLLTPFLFGQEAQKIGNRANQDIGLCKNLGGGSEVCVTIDSAGATTVGGDLSVTSGAFTSQGIDDNADATALTLDVSENATFNGSLTATSGAFTSIGIDDNAAANAITIDSSQKVVLGNSLGINVTPTEEFEILISTGSGVTETADAHVVIDSNDGNVLQLLGGSASIIGLYIGNNGESNFEAGLQYDTGANEVIIRSNGADAININTDLETQLEVPVDGDCNSEISTGNVCSGTFSIHPTTGYINVTNVAVFSHQVAMFSRTGDVVSVSVLVNIDVTIADADTNFYIAEASLPFSPNFIGSNECVGVGTKHDNNGGDFTNALIRVNSNSSGCLFTWRNKNNNGNQEGMLNFKYKL